MIKDKDISVYSVYQKAIMALNQVKFQHPSVGKVKVHPVICHDWHRGGSRGITLLILTSALDGVGAQRHAPAGLPPERSPET
jgi:hypothetical protein